MKKLLKIINDKEKFKNPPIWLMRQAGRYLPEYQEIRSRAESFLALCYNPELASEITLQPIRRFGFDAAIIFSDILVIPDALGIKVEFVKNEGPKLDFRLEDKNSLSFLKTANVEKHLQPVFETISLTKSRLDNNTALIGFSGAPWTLATYIIEGGGSKNFEKVRKTALLKPDLFKDLIDILTEAVVNYLFKQIEAGVEVVKLFDSWAGTLSENEFTKWVIKPQKEIVKKIKEKYPSIGIIAFPRGAGAMYCDFFEEVKPDVLAIDQNIPCKWAKKELQDKLNCTIQGNLDNFTLSFGSEEVLRKEISLIMETFRGKSFIFNLGHGVLPDTPIKNIELLLKLVRGF